MDKSVPSLNFYLCRFSLRSFYKFLFGSSVILFLAGWPMLITIYRHFFTFDTLEHIILSTVSLVWILFNFIFGFMSLVALFSLADHQEVTTGISYGHLVQMSVGSFFLAVYSLFFSYMVWVHEVLPIEDKTTLVVYSLVLSGSSLVFWVLSRILITAVHNERHKSDFAKPIHPNMIEITSS